MPSASDISFAAYTGFKCARVTTAFFESKGSSSGQFAFSIGLVALSSLSIMLEIIESVRLGEGFFASSMLFSKAFFSVGTTA